LPWSLVSLPGASPIGAEVPGVSTLHDPRGSTRHDLVVVVVLPHIATGVDRQFVSIPEVVCHHAQVLAARVHTKGQPSYPNLAVIAAHISLVGPVIGSTACIDTTRAQCPSALISHNMRTCIARVEI